MPDASTITSTPNARTTDAIDTEVTRLRAHARNLHAARAEATRASDTNWGGLRDDAAREADAARHGGARAQLQARQQHEAADGYNQNARALEVTADEAAAAGNHARAAELREDAQQQRALAVAADERAARANKAAADQNARADQLEQEVRDYDKRITGDGDERTPAIERLADQLDERADLLAEAADQQRAALRYEAEGNAQAAARASQAATDALTRADAIQPAYSSVDATVLTNAGITTWPGRATDDEPEPGSETIDTDSRPGAPTDETDGSGIDPSDTLNPFEDDAAALQHDDPNATGLDDGGEVAGIDDPTSTPFDANDETFAMQPAAFDDGGLSAFDASANGSDDAGDFATTDDFVGAGASDDTAFEFDA
jgi:hypothetical protein